MRREWLRQFLTRKTPPKTAAVFLARSLAAGGHDFTRAAGDGHPLACDLFGVEHRAGYYGGSPPSPGLDALLDSATDARAQVITLGLVLAAPRPPPAPTPGATSTPAPPPTLRFITDHGYTLTDVERLACGEAPQPEPEHDA